MTDIHDDAKARILDACRQAEQAGIEIVRGTYHFETTDGPERCCPLAAFWWANNSGCFPDALAIDKTIVRYASEQLGVSRRFMGGVDNFPRPAVDTESYQLGQEVAEALDLR